MLLDGEPGRADDHGATLRVGLTGVVRNRSAERKRTLWPLLGSISDFDKSVLAKLFSEVENSFSAVALSAAPDFHVQTAGERECRGNTFHLTHDRMILIRRDKRHGRAEAE